MTSVQAKLKRNNSNYSGRIDKMVPIAQKIADSKDPIDSMNEIVPTLDAMDAYVLGMIIADMIRDGTLHISGLMCVQR